MRNIHSVQTHHWWCIIQPKQPYQSIKLYMMHIILLIHCFQVWFSLSPEQSNPLPRKPCLHLHLCDPWVLMHSAWWLHLCVLDTHSFISENTMSYESFLSSLQIQLHMQCIYLIYIKHKSECTLFQQPWFCKYFNNLSKHLKDYSLKCSDPWTKASGSKWITIFQAKVYLKIWKKTV